jgi:hypothetical protein
MGSGALRVPRRSGSAIASTSAETLGDASRDLGRCLPSLGLERLETALPPSPYPLVHAGAGNPRLFAAEDVGFVKDLHKRGLFQSERAIIGLDNRDAMIPPRPLLSY